MNIFAKIIGIKYAPFLCKKLNNFIFNDLNIALSKESTFSLDIDNSKFAVSQWVSPKRTRTYPYARVYDSLNSAKKITIIPIIKDEGRDGDRGFLQWDTISLMSLLGVYVVISYYSNAIKSPKYENKITNQEFQIEYIKEEIKKLLFYQSDALHWNLSQIDKVGEIGKKAIECYEKISNKLNVEMHSKVSAEKRIEELAKGKESFMNLSRSLAEKAQKRESITVQPKEKLVGKKATLTIKNYLGGYYYLTCDEVEINKENVYLIEGKHTKKDRLPSLEDIKDGLLKMILFTNLKEVKIDKKEYNPIPILRLTTGIEFKIEETTETEKEMLNNLKKESITNGFKLIINNKENKP